MGMGGSTGQGVGRERASEGQYQFIITHKGEGYYDERRLSRLAGKYGGKLLAWHNHYTGEGFTEFLDFFVPFRSPEGRIGMIVTFKFESPEQYKSFREKLRERGICVRDS